MTQTEPRNRPLREPGRSFGIWSGSFRIDDHSAVADAAAELDAVGWAALWYPGGMRETFAAARTLLDATERIAVATGIANIWISSPEESAVACGALEQDHPGRFLLGLGVSHEMVVVRANLGDYSKPLSRMRSYLESLDVADPPVAVDDRIIAALGPRMLGLAAERSLGTHPYLVTVEQEASIRATIGLDARVLSEVGVVLESGPAAARSVAREAIAGYLALPNYVNSWKRAGFDDDDVTGGASDRLIDALFAWGTPEQIAARLGEHLDAGADHVCVQVLGAVPGTLPTREWQILGDVLGLGAPA